MTNHPGKQLLERLRETLEHHGKTRFFAQLICDDIPPILAYVASETARADAAEAERNTHKAKSLSRGKLLERFRDTILNLCDHAKDEGDRAYFGSTNDLDDLREIAREMDAWKWDAIIRERSEEDPYQKLRDQSRRIIDLERQLTEARERKTMDKSPTEIAPGDITGTITASSIQSEINRDSLVERVAKILAAEYSDPERTFHELPAWEAEKDVAGKIIDALFKSMLR